MIKLHFAPLTRSIRIRWLLEELGIPYELLTTEFNRDGSRGFAQDTPSGNYPFIEDGDVTLSESGAIVQYLLDGMGTGDSSRQSGQKIVPLICFGYIFRRGQLPIRSILQSG